MARAEKISLFLQIFLYFSLVLCCFSKIVESASHVINEDNWKDILEGEWMVEFYAPWCPACNNLAPAWKELSSQASRRKLDLNTGAVDVTTSPGLSGRFVVTALPTIFHVKDGEFRQYKGPRDADSMLTFVTNQRWKQTDPIPSWKAPHSLQMTLVSQFFKLSQELRTVHNALMETYGLPTWGSYLFFAVATIFIGALLGLLLVCIIDLLYPPKRAGKAFVPQSELERRAAGDRDAREKSDDDQELLNEDIVDDAENENDSDAEKNSPSDTSDEEKPEPDASGDSKPGAEPEGKAAEVRKRRPRKAD